MRLKFHGCRGSFPVSVHPNRVREIIKTVWEFGNKKKISSWQELEKALDKQPHSFSQIYGGHTTCIEIRDVKTPMPIFIDAGTGLTSAGLDPSSVLNRPEFKTGNGKVAFFMTHTHWDHIIGLPTLEQLFRVGNEFHFYGVHKKLSKRMAHIFSEDHFPVPFKVVEKNLHFHQIDLNKELSFGDLHIRHFPQTHPGGSFVYRFEEGAKSLVFATDTELKNIHPPHMTPGENIYSNADVMVLDAQYSPEDYITKEGYGHSQIHVSVDLAVREKAKILYLFHQHPYYEDKMIDRQLERARKHLVDKHGKVPLKIFMAKEGQEIKI